MGVSSGHQSCNAIHISPLHCHVAIPTAKTVTMVFWVIVSCFRHRPILHTLYVPTSLAQTFQGMQQRSNIFYIKMSFLSLCSDFHRKRDSFMNLF